MRMERELKKIGPQADEVGEQQLPAIGQQLKEIGPQADGGCDEWWLMADEGLLIIRRKMGKSLVDWEIIRIFAAWNNKERK